MATASQFSTAADSFEDLAHALTGGQANLDGAWSTDVVLGGRLMRTIERALDATHANTMGVVADLHSHAAECRLRAALCAAYDDAKRTYDLQYTQYEDDLEAWNEDPEGDRPWPPRRPDPPGPWADLTA